MGCTSLVKLTAKVVGGASASADSSALKQDVVSNVQHKVAIK
jgi:hypothetical protein